MTVISFNFTKINAEKKEGARGKVNIANNISIKDVQSMDLKLGKASDKALKFVFTYEAKYEPEIGSVELNGELVWLSNDAKVKEVEKEWKKNKKLGKEVVEEVMTNILTKCNIEAIVMSREINLPPPVPMPKVKTKEE